uniref:Uncharacterized protein n=1 Tax=Anguilla anguilla TaxID=7936 RepID=A0A0E9T6W1_ANGAN
MIFYILNMDTNADFFVL